MKKIYVLILILTATFVMAGCEKKMGEKATDSKNDTTEKQDKIMTVKCSGEMEEEDVKQTVTVALTSRNDTLEEMKLTGEMKDGTWEMYIKDGKPVSIKAHMIDTENSENYEEFNDLSEDTKKQMLDLMESVIKDQLVKEYSVLADYVQYIDIKFNVENNNLILDVNIDVEKIGFELLQTTDFFNDMNMDDLSIIDEKDLDEAVKYLEQQGLVCEKSI